MRSQKNRSRSKGNRNNNNRSMGNIVNRVFDSSGPEGKVRGTPQQIIDKYNQLTRDAQLANDRVAAENFQQHAEHYARMLGEAQREQDARRAEQEAQQAHQQQAREARQAREDDAPTQDQPVVTETAEKSESRPEQKSFGDVIDVPASGDSGLVTTPESAPKPKRPRARRAPKKAAEAPAENQGDAPNSPEEGPQAAE
ncbi:DUF4167 domain-containing protein [Nioella aestuarii]|uniref:DUF4167 domain-containing protein n=1 Tax=Nioella aestuarii TaxID=1662864 RepID=UPI003D7FF5AD